jgi:hypothetical protein
MIQTFDTVVTDINGTHSAVCHVVPARSIPDREADYQGLARAKRIGLQPIMAISSSQLPFAIGALITANKQKENPIKLYRKVLETPLSDVALLLGEDSFKFAEEISQLSFIPFEQSPIELASFSKLFSEVGAVGLGAYAGWVVAGPTPLLFLTVPAGMVLFGAAAGFATGCEKGLKERVRRWIAGEDSEITDPSVHVDIEFLEDAIEIGNTILDIQD